MFLVAARTQASAAAPCFRPSLSESLAGAGSASLPRPLSSWLTTACISTFSPLPELTPEAPPLTHLGGVGSWWKEQSKNEKSLNPKGPG